MSFIRVIFSLIVLIGLFFNNQMLHAQEEWEEMRDDEGIKVFEKDGGNRLNDIKLKFFVKSSMNGIINFMLNQKGYQDMVSNIESVRLIKEDNDTTRFYLIHIAVEPFIEREALVKVSFERTERKVKCNMKLDNSINYKLEHTSVMPFHAKWVFTPIHSKLMDVELTYSGKVDDYNDFIYAIIEELFKEQLFGMALNMQENVVKTSYQNQDHNLW